MIAMTVTVNYITGRGENEVLPGGCKLNKKRKEALREKCQDKPKEKRAKQAIQKLSLGRTRGNQH